MVPEAATYWTGEYWKMFVAKAEATCTATGRTEPDGWYTGLRPKGAATADISYLLKLLIAASCLLLALVLETGAGGALAQLRVALFHDNFSLHPTCCCLDILQGRLQLVFLGIRRVVMRFLHVHFVQVEGDL